MIGKDFLSLSDFEPEDIRSFLAVAVWLKQRRAAGIRENALVNKTLGLIFEKPSLRTRVSFEVGMLELGGQNIYIRGEEVGLGTREPVQDVARVLSRYVGGIMIRTFAHDTVEALARHATIPIINGLSDECHPCQALADVLTILEHLGRLQDVGLVFIGDGNNVARSLARICTQVGARFTLACPADYAFSQADIDSFGDAWGKSVRQVHDPAAAVAGADILYSDVWTSMGQEAEREQRLNAFAGYQINADLMGQAARDVKIMHCLPAHRGEEITDEAFESSASIVFDQAENRLDAQKAILRVLLADDGADVVDQARHEISLP